MKDFIMCMKEEVKDKLLQNGFNLIASNENKDGIVYTFENKNKFNFSQLNFSEEDIIITNRLVF